MERELIFRIHERLSGKDYSIYSNGEIEGFESDVWIENHHLALMQIQRAKARVSE